MPLKLQLSKGDIVTIGDNTILKVLSTGRTMQLELAAPQDIAIKRIPADLRNYRKNDQREARGLPRSGSPKFDRNKKRFSCEIPYQREEGSDDFLSNKPWFPETGGCE